MSGTTIVYGDRPIAKAQPDGGVFPTFEFVQYLERLSRSHASAVAGAPELVAQVATNTSNIATLTGQVAGMAPTVASNANDVSNLYGLIGAQFPITAGVAVTSAIPLTSGTVTTIASVSGVYGANVVLGMLCLTGTGTVTLASVSTGITAGVIETAPGAFATGFFGGGASPTTLGVDLSVGSFARIVTLASPPDAVLLNARVTFTGTISAYGSLIILPFGTVRHG